MQTNHFTHALQLVCIGKVRDTCTSHTKLKGACASDNTGMLIVLFLQVSTACGQPQDNDSDDDDDDLDELESLHGRRKRQTFYQPINPIPEQEEQSRVLHIPSGSQLGFDALSRAFTVELRCLDLFEETVVAVPDQLCFLKGRISTSNNVNCWAGSFLATKER